MAQLGRRNQLTILRESPSGLNLDDGEGGEILLPGRYIPPDAAPGGKLDVFVYRDSEDRIVATTETPHAMVGDFACLRIVGILPHLGCFLDWGLSKDLLLPLKEQVGSRNVGDWIVVYVMQDEKSDRIIATTRLEKGLADAPPAYAKEQPVKLLIYKETPLGYKAIVNNTHTGLLYRTNVGVPIHIGQRLDAFVREVRPDGKIDLALDRSGFARVAPITDQILNALKVAGGRLPYHDKSTPEEIRAAFGVSKKAFKQAVGTLYRNRRILIEPDGIRVKESRLFPEQG